MIKVLFFIHDLGQGGAEKVLVNLVNNMDYTKFDITVMVLFGGGVNEQFLNSCIKFKRIFPRSVPGNSKLLKLMTGEQLHKMFVREHYDIEISYLEGPTARIIGGGQRKDTKIVSWIHSKQSPIELLAYSFRSVGEAMKCYNRFHRTVFVSEDIRKDFCDTLNFTKQSEVLYNTVESNKILALSREQVEIFNDQEIRLIAVGTLKKIKGYDRLLEVFKRLKKEGYPVHLYILGTGPLQEWIEQYIRESNLVSAVTLLGYQTNPYKYMSKCDLFICSSYSEGFSTAVTEALIVGTPVCTVDVAGMRELLGNNQEYGVIVPNNTQGLYEGIKQLLDNQEILKDYRQKAKERGTKFSTKNTVKAVEEMLINLVVE